MRKMNLALWGTLSVFSLAGMSSAFAVDVVPSLHGNSLRCVSFDDVRRNALQTGYLIKNPAAQLDADGVIELRVDARFFKCRSLSGQVLWAAVEPPAEERVVFESYANAGVFGSPVGVTGAIEGSGSAKVKFEVREILDSENLARLERGELAYGSLRLYLGVPFCNLFTGCGSDPYRASNYSHSSGFYVLDLTMKKTQSGIEIFPTLSK